MVYRLDADGVSPSMRPEPLRVLRGMVGDGGAHVLGGLLAADTEALHQVLCDSPRPSHQAAVSFRR